jgi:molybdate transport system substrate-binding protein
VDGIMKISRLIVFALAMAPWAPAASTSGITVFAAASMKDVLEHSAKEYLAAHGVAVVFSFASSSILARQIQAGAAADAFISADEEWMDWLAERDLIQTNSRTVITGNTLVIAAAPANTAREDPSELVADRFAMGDPAHVPAGRYAQSALETLGLWERVRPNAVLAENVRVALEYARRGEVGAAIVYGSDLQVAPDLTAAYVFPPESHPPITYPAAVVADGSDKAADFIDFLSAEAGQRIFALYGFEATADERN